MRVLIQRVLSARLTEATTSTNDPIVSIGKGLLILVGFEPNDTPVSIEQLVQKIKNLRIFSDPSGKLNLSAPQVDAEYLLVSQFTLYAECKYGNRPSFTKAAPKTRAKEYYEHFVNTCRRVMGENQVKNGPFGASLHVELVNDGPVTIWLDSTEVL